MKHLFFVAAAVSTTLSACAEYPTQIDAAYIPSIIYKGASCSELTTERTRLASHVEEVTRQQSNTASWDTSLVITGTFIAWPALLGLPFTRDQHARLAVAKGHYDAIMKAGRRQGCGSDFYEKAAAPVYVHERGDFPPL